MPFLSIILFQILFPFIDSVSAKMNFCDNPAITLFSSVLNLHTLSSIDPLAVCNDGTPGAYYFKPYTFSEFRNHFLIHLPGGSQCWDQTSCNHRWETNPDYMSSSQLNSTCQKTGILDDNEKVTPFWGANKVMIAYCSSDGYMGDAAASERTWGYHFRGQRLVYATIKALIEYHGLNENSKIVFSGGSAGARGVMALIDELVKNHFPRGSKVFGFLDSPFYIDVKSFTPYFKGFQYQEQQKVKYFNVGNVISSECAALYPGNETWKCLYGQYRIPLLKTPYFMVASQYDAYQIPNDIGAFPPFTNPELLSYVNEFGNITQGLLLELEAKKKEGVSYFSWTCFNHDVSETLAFVNYNVSSGVTQFDALSDYLLAVGFFSMDETQMVRSLFEDKNEREKGERKKQTKSWIDRCTGFECGGCVGQHQY